MKIREGFVSNSSSSSFLITNLTNEKKTLKDFALETAYLVDEFNSYYRADETLSNFFKDVENQEYVWEPKESINCVFGDEDGTTMGRVYDNMLRNDGWSNSFAWKLIEMLR